MPGDRVPDAQLAAAGTGEAVRLFELLRDPRHALILLEGLAPTVEGDAALEEMAHEFGDRLADRIAVRTVAIDPQRTGGPLLGDPSGSLHRRFGATAPTTLLVRPDGYLAFRGPIDAAGRTALNDYLRRIFNLTRDDPAIVS